MNISNIKIDSITYHLLHKYELKPHLCLFEDFMKKKYSKKKYILVHLLLSSYQINNYFEHSPIYKILEEYIYKHQRQILHHFIWL